MYNPILKFFDYLRYREAVKKADNAHKQTGHRYYVMPTNNSSGGIKLVVMDRANFRILKKKKYINRKATVRDLVTECFYCTPYNNGNGYLDEKGRKLKLAVYFSYCKSVRELNKNGSRK